MQVCKLCFEPGSSDSFRLVGDVLLVILASSEISFFFSPPLSAFPSSSIKRRIYIQTQRCCFVTVGTVYPQKATERISEYPSMFRFQLSIAVIRHLTTLELMEEAILKPKSGVTETLTRSSSSPVEKCEMSNLSIE